MAFREMRNLLPALGAVVFSAYKVLPPSANLVDVHSSSSIIPAFDEIPASEMNASIGLPGQVNHDTIIREGMSGNFFFELLNILLVILFEVPFFRQLLAAVLLWSLHKLIRVARGFVPAPFLHHLAFLLTGLSHSAQQRQIACMGRQLLWLDTTASQRDRRYWDLQRTFRETQRQLQNQIDDLRTSAASAARTKDDQIARLTKECDGLAKRVRKLLDSTSMLSFFTLANSLVRKIQERSDRRGDEAASVLRQEQDSHRVTRDERDQAVAQRERMERDRQLNREDICTQDIESQRQGSSLDGQETSSVAEEQIVTPLDQAHASEVKELRDSLAESETLRKAAVEQAEKNLDDYQRLVNEHQQVSSQSPDPELQNKVTDLEGAAVTLKNEARTAREDMQSEREHAESLANANADLERRLNALAGEKKREEDQLSRDNAQLKEQLADLRGEERKRKDAEAKTGEMEREVASLRERQEKMESEKQEKEQSHSDALAVKAKDAADQAMEAHQAGRAEAFRQRDEEAASAMQSTSTTVDDLHATQQQLQAARDAVQASNTQVDNLTLQVQQLQQQPSTAQGQIQTLLNERAQANEQYSLMERNLQAYQSTLSETRDRLQNAESSIRRFQTRHNDVVSDLQARHSSAASGLQATINNLNATINSKDVELKAVADDKARLLSLLDSVAGLKEEDFVDDTEFVVSALMRAEQYIGAQLKDDGDDLRAVIEDEASDIEWSLVFDDINSKGIDETPIRNLVQDPSKLELVRQALAINWRLCQLAMCVSSPDIDGENKKAIVGHLLVTPREQEDLQAWTLRYDAEKAQAPPTSTYADPGSLWDNAGNDPYYTQGSEQTSALPTTSSSSAYDASCLDPALSDPTAATTAGTANPPSSDQDDPFKNQPSVDDLVNQALVMQRPIHPLPARTVGSTVNPLPTGSAHSTQVAQATASQKRKAVDSGEVDFPKQAVASKKVGGDLTGASRVPKLPPDDQPDTSA